MVDHAELCKALRSYRQADADGVMVLVSRQACDEAAAEIERLRAFVDFVNLWTWRDSRIDDTERLSVIKHHPTAKQRREALNEQKVDEK